jgi:hypothetical protein
MTTRLGEIMRANLVPGLDFVLIMSTTDPAGRGVTSLTTSLPNADVLECLKGGVRAYEKVKSS